MHYRQADKSDITGMALIRAAEWGTMEYWSLRISGYMHCELNPQQALVPRVLYVASDGDSIAGFIAGHLTRRYTCDGELQWINVSPSYRGSGIASTLLHMLFKWFIAQNAFRICVDVDPANLTARKFYNKHGAAELNKHWLVWNNIDIVAHS